uniref:Rab5-bind domain-containing protein n=1 Tax=Heterorhabditis bacteriophora TaxID=37862 RepID=A0A1I7X4U9_HETBA
MHSSSKPFLKTRKVNSDEICRSGYLIDLRIDSHLLKNYCSLCGYENAWNYNMNRDSQNSVSRSMHMVNIPPYVLAQLEKANDVIRRQSAELDHLRGSDREIENLALRTQLMEMDNRLRSDRERFIEQETIVMELSNEIRSLSKDKNILQEKYLEMERKYKKAKAASKEFARVIEASSGTNDVHSYCPSLLERSRAKHDTNLQIDGSIDAENIPKSMIMDKVILPTMVFWRYYVHLNIQEKSGFDIIALKLALENSQTDVENLKSELEKERQLSQSLHDDLDANRKLYPELTFKVLSRDTEIMELTSKLSECERKLKQCEDHLSCTSTDLALERARCDEVTLSLQESEALLSQARSDSLFCILDNQRLIEESRDATQLIISLQAKLDAQGKDLISTKKALQRVKGEYLSSHMEPRH